MFPGGGGDEGDQAIDRRQWKSVDRNHFGPSKGEFTVSGLEDGMVCAILSCVGGGIRQVRVEIILRLAGPWLRNRASRINTLKNMTCPDPAIEHVVRGTRCRLRFR